MNCFTLEASFHAYFTPESRETIELTTEMFETMGGEHLCQAFLEYQCLIEDDEKHRLQLRQEIKAKKNKKRQRCGTSQ